MNIQKKCIVCGKEFTTKNDKGIYCGNSCRVKAHRQREKGEQSELAKNITEKYYDELSFFKFQLNEIYEDVRKLQVEMVSVTKYLYSFAEKVAGIPDMRKIETDITDLSEKFEEKIEKLKISNEEKIDRNDYNIRLAGLKINEFAVAINRINERTSNNLKTEIIDKILDSDMIPDLANKFINKKPKSSE